MQVVDTLVRAAKAPIRLGLSAGGIGLSAMRSAIDEARRIAGHEPPRSAGWRRPYPPPVSSPGPEVRSRGRSARGRSADTPPEPPPPPVPPAPADAPPVHPPPRADAPPPVPPAAAEGPAIPIVPPPGAKQVDDEPEQVAELAEAGAEDGAGAEVHVDPPWDGYDAMTAADIRDRLVTADAGLAAAVALYENLGRGRVSVVRAAERRVAARGS